MTIRTRLTLWYAAIMFVSLLAMGVLSYRQFAPDPHDAVSGSEEGSESAKEDEGDYREALRNIFWCGVPAALLALGGGWWLMRKAMVPVASMTQAAERINERNLGEQLIRTGSGDEFDRLTQVFNAMTARLHDSFQRVREFTLNASHELKTPLAVMHAELETALQEQPAATGQRERLLSQLDEVQRLAKIVDGLTLLTRADAGQITLAREPVRLDELVRDTWADAQSLARPYQVRVELGACEETTVTGDRHRLRQLLLNLTDNAIKYNVPKGTVLIALRRQEAVAEITIANTGKGIAPEILPRVFEPFFRGDPSHSNVVEGCGLGLSIAQWIVTAHGGSIELASRPGVETIATLRLPLQVASGQRV
jgi:signal transduction histidine kinase